MQTAKKSSDTSYIGDGYCDDRFNWDVCNFDSGDCCGESVNTMFCHDCICLQNTAIFDTCNYKDKVGNGQCDDIVNDLDCAFDGGKLIYVSK
jgi:hypothetical protein